MHTYLLKDPDSEDYAVIIDHSIWLMHTYLLQDPDSEDYAVVINHSIWLMHTYLLKDPDSEDYAVVIDHTLLVDDDHRSFKYTFYNLFHTALLFLGYFACE